MSQVNHVESIEIPCLTDQDEKPFQSGLVLVGNPLLHSRLGYSFI
jgi:hypothetical protein